jgi:hypothetical protein
MCRLLGGGVVALVALVALVVLVLTGGAVASQRPFSDWKS